MPRKMNHSRIIGLVGRAGAGKNTVGDLTYLKAVVQTICEEVFR